MSRLIRLMLSMALAFAVFSVVPVEAQSASNDRGFLPEIRDYEPWNVKLRGITQVPAVSTNMEGQFHLEIVGDDIVPERDGLAAIQTLKYILRYRSADDGVVTAAHLHFGRKFTNGGIMSVLCMDPVAEPTSDEEPVLDEEPASTIPACPDGEAELIGELNALSIIGPSAQGIEPGEFLDALHAFAKGAVYVNVHTRKFPDGEIRGQLNDFHFRPIIIVPPHCGPDGVCRPDPLPCDVGADGVCHPDPLPCDVTADGQCRPDPLPCDLNADGLCHPDPLPCDLTADGECKPDPLPCDLNADGLCHPDPLPCETTAGVVCEPLPEPLPCDSSTGELCEPVDDEKHIPGEGEEPVEGDPNEEVSLQPRTR